MVDWYGAKYAGKWHKEDKYILVPTLGIIFMLFFFVLMMVLSVLSGNISSIMVNFIGIVIFLSTLFFTRGIYKQRKGMWIKIFSHDNDTVVRTIENVLKQNKITYNKLKTQTQDYIIKFPLKYAEIFEIIQYQLSIRIQKQMAVGSAIEVGPASLNNEVYIENIKKNLDYVFTPRGLEESHSLG